MKFRVGYIDGGTRRRAVKTVEADTYERDGSTVTFIRGKLPVATYSNVHTVELVPNAATEALADALEDPVDSAG